MSTGTSPHPRFHRPVESYNGNEPFIYFSYSHAYRSYVREVARLLSEKGVRVFTDGGESTINMPEQFYERIKNCSAFVLDLNHRSVDSQRVRKEIRSITKNTPIILLEGKKTSLDPELSHIFVRAQHLKIKPILLKNKRHLPEYTVKKLLPLLPKEVQG